jgi:CHAT domain-containing protein/tetratricopeptide (TPR) repeat protein
MFVRVTIGAILLWLSVGAIPCTAAAHTARSVPDPRIDAIYLALGQGDNPKAADLSADLLAGTAETDARRALVLQARLDVLTQCSELDAPAGQALRDALQKFGEHDAHGQALVQHMAIATALAHKDMQAALELTQTRLADTSPIAAEESAELHYLQARAAATLNGRLPLAREQAELALAFWQDQHDVRARWHEAEIDYIIGTAYSHTGSARDALEWLQRGSKLAASTFGDDSLARIRIDMDHASVLLELGRSREALDLREALFSATRKRYGENSSEAAKAEAQIGAGLQEIGDYPAARERYMHAEAIMAALPNAPEHDRALIANNYGNLLQEMGQEDAALAHYRQAIEAWGDSERTTHVRAVVTANIGNTEFRLGHYQDAIADFQRALALREQSDGKDSPGLAFALEGLGSATLALGNYVDAEQYYRRALAARGRALAPDHPTLGPLNFGLALSLWGRGDIDGAFDLAVQTAKHQQAMLTTFAAGFSERQSVAYRQLLMPATALAVTLAAQRGDATRIATAWQLSMVERGLVARAQAQRLAAVRAAHDPAMAQAWQSWQRANSALGEAWMSTTTTAAQMTQLRADTETAERALWRSAGHAPGEGAAEATPLTDLAHALPSDGVLIAFSEGVTSDPARQLRAGDKQAPEDWYAFALVPDGGATLRRVGSIDALSAQLHAWYEDLRNPHADPARLRGNGLALRQALLDPVVAADAGRRLFIVPEGELYRLSFAALPDDKQGFLIETGTRVHTLAHESELTLPAAAAHAQQMLLAGAPDFPGATAAVAGVQRQLCRRATRQGFSAIPNAARELGGLQALLSASSTTPQIIPSQITLIEGARATKANVLAALPRANVAHLATHGFSLDESCSDDRADPDAASAAGATRGVTLDRPQPPAASAAQGIADAGILSGLAFSGASLAPGSAAVGVLSAGELGTLDLSHLDWIALSACDSGLGPIGRNEGVFGMRRALRLAGARTVVLSLWQVDDAATADLMQSLYRARFIAHDDVPDAMATAMRSLITARRARNESDHPYYWAAFISEGGWR